MEKQEPFPHVEFGVLTKRYRAVRFDEDSPYHIVAHGRRAADTLCGLENSAERQVDAQHTFYLTTHPGLAWIERSHVTVRVCGMCRKVAFYPRPRREDE